MQTSGEMRRENAASHSSVIARLDRATQYSETSMIEPRSRGVLDPRLRASRCTDLDCDGMTRSFDLAFPGDGAA